MTLFIFLSCENSNDTSVKLQNYLPLKVGNYWVYQHYMIDTLGNETKFNLIDSVYIKRDSLINSNKYFVFYDSNPGFLFIPIFIRDSSGYLVNEKGQKIFSQTNFSDTINRTNYFATQNLIYCSRTIRMEKSANLVNVPMGSFEAINAKETNCYFIDGYLNPYPQSKRPIVYNNVYYTPNIGIILHTYRYASIPYVRYEKRLIRCKIN
jgi:hypothetical protein